MAGGGEFRVTSSVVMDCSDEAGGLAFVSVRQRRSPGLNPRLSQPDFEDWDWQWGCMDGTTGSSGQPFTSKSRKKQDQTVDVTCGMLSRQDDLRTKVNSSENGVGIIVSGTYRRDLVGGAVSICLARSFRYVSRPGYLDSAFFVVLRSRRAPRRPPCWRP